MDQGLRGMAGTEDDVGVRLRREEGETGHRTSLIVSHRRMRLPKRSKTFSQYVTKWCRAAPLSKPPTFSHQSGCTKWCSVATGSMPCSCRSGSGRGRASAVRQEPRGAMALGSSDRREGGGRRSRQGSRGSPSTAGRPTRPTCPARAPGGPIQTRSGSSCSRAP